MRYTVNGMRTRNFERFAHSSDDAIPLFGVMSISRVMSGAVYAAPEVEAVGRLQWVFMVVVEGREA